MVLSVDTEGHPYGCPRSLRIQETVCLEDKVIVILVPRTMIGVGIQNQLRVRQVLCQPKRVDGVDDHVMVSADDQRRLLNVLEVCKPLSWLVAPVTDRCNLCGRNFLTDGLVTILGARVVALEELASRRLALLGIREKDPSATGSQEGYNWPRTLERSPA